VNRTIDDPNIFPTRANCHREIPEERFLWMFVGMPDITSGAMPMPVSYLRKFSAHLVDLGLMDQCPACGHREEPTKWLDLPADPHSLLNPGVWREGKPPEQAAPTLDEILAKMPAAEVAKIEATAREVRERREAQGGVQ
jgi:hypothetical protein